MKVYMERSLVENKAFARSLARRIWEKGSKCCVCGDHDVSVWIIDGVYVANGCTTFVRVLCKKHEEEWKNFKTLNYKMFNGVMLLERPHQNPAEMWVNMPWSEFASLVEAHTRDDRYEARFIKGEPLESYLTKNAHLVFVGKLNEFLKGKET